MLEPSSLTRHLLLHASSLVVFALGACQDVPPTDDRHDEHDVPAAPVPGSSASDPDGQPPESEPPASLVLPTPNALPLGPTDVLRLGRGSDIDVLAAWHVAADGSLAGYFDTSDVPFTRSSLHRFSSPDGRHFTPPQALSLGTARLVGGPTVVRHGSEAFLYFVSSAGVQQPATVSRARILEHGRLGPPSDLRGIPGVDWILSWPSFIPLASGGTALAFRDGRSIPQFATSSDGASFAAPRAVTTKQGAMATVAELADGTLVYTYQYSTDANPMIPVAILSHDHGATWSATPIAITEAANAHDASILPRADGGADLYFIHPSESGGFSLYRRKLGPDGTLGTEQRLTTSEVGEPSKPRAIRLGSGKVLVAYADIAARSSDLSPKVQQLVLAELPGDAP